MNVENNHKQKLNLFLASAIGGGVAEACIIPLCTIVSYSALNVANNKTKPINTNILNFFNVKNLNMNLNMNNIRQVFKTIRLSNPEGGLIKGLYKASSWQIAAQMLSTSTKFSFYELMKTKFMKSKLKDKIDNKMEKIKLFGIGVTSNLMAVTLTHPFDTIKINILMSGENQSKKQEFWNKILSKNQNQNNKIKNSISTLYKGFDKAMLKSVVGGLTFYPIRDLMRSKFDSSIVSNSLTAIISTTIIHVFDIAKRRNQLGLETKFSFKGLPWNILRVLLHFNIQMATIEYLFP